MTATAATGPALAATPAAPAGRPSRTSAGFSPRRTQNRKAVAPSAEAEGREVGLADVLDQRAQDLGQGLAAAGDAEEVARPGPPRSGARSR